MLHKDELYVSVDIEADGPIPGEYSMLSFGAVAFDWQGNEVDVFYRKLKRISDKQHPDTMKWWEGHTIALEEATTHAILPRVAMRMFATWLSDFELKPVLMANPAAWDVMFLTWYAVKFTGEFLPTNFRALDIKSYECGLWKGGYLGTSPEEAWKLVKARADQNPFPHHALHDAREQGQAFFDVVNLYA